jgi:hypothetical protein
MLTEVIIAFAIVATCVVIHTMGMLTFAEWMFRQKALIYGTRRMTNHALLLIVVFAVVIFLHLTEAALWAGFYWSQSLFENYETSLYFSLISYTTIGFGDVVLPKSWRLLGAVEGVSGVLLCGVSTAFIFAIVTVLFRIRIENANGLDKRQGSDRLSKMTVQ